MPAQNVNKIIDTLVYNETMILYVSATEGEAAQVPSDYPLIVTGIGIIRATLTLTEYLARADELPERIINFGTAGSLSGNTGIFEIDHVFQHDFDHKVIEQIIGKPFPNGIDLPTVSTLPAARLATGDSFVNDPDTRARLAQQAQLCDMEGYAIAFVAQHFGIPCTLIKQVSDNADDAAADTWVDAVDRGAQDLAGAIRTLNQTLNRL